MSDLLALDAIRLALNEILSHVKMSPEIAFQILKGGEFLHGYKLKGMDFECPGCHSVYRTTSYSDNWASLSSRGRFVHAPTCPDAVPVKQSDVFYAKEKP